jgi:peptidyl-prolyl cis-trans isomerase B (cyclophilin B)
LRSHLNQSSRQSAITKTLSVISVVLIATGIAACGSSTGTTTSSTTSGPTAGSVECTYEASPRGAAKDVGVPPAQEPATGASTATIALTGGTVEIALDRETAPCTVGSFAFLSGAGYYNDTPCHRLTSSPTLSVLQCGDPSGTGSGGPGYSYADETNPDMVYPAGTVAMANAGPDTNGSQFFLVYADSTLPPSYTVFGTITKGLDVLTGIAAKGTSNGGNDGAPANPVTISAITIAD